MTELNLSIILTDGSTQSRTSLNQEMIGEYAKAMTAGAIFPPVTVFYDGTYYWLVDGFHRLEAARNINASSIAAEIIQGTHRDAILHSVGVNATHGLRRSNADKRRAVEKLLKDPEWNQWSDSAIAKACKVDNKTVTHLRVDLGIPKSEARKGTDGRTIDTAKIGKRSDKATSKYEANLTPDNSEFHPNGVCAKTETTNVTDEDSDSSNSIRVLYIESKNIEQIEAVVETFQITSSSISAKIECSVGTLITLLKQTQKHSMLTENICQQIGVVKSCTEITSSIT